jgi:hypothetical protein
VQRIEGQGRFARAADARDDGQLVTRNGQFHILKVVGTGSLDVDGRVQDSGPYSVRPPGEDGSGRPLISRPLIRFYLFR